MSISPAIGGLWFWRCSYIGAQAGRGECEDCSLFYLSLLLPPYWFRGEPVAEYLLSTSFMSLNFRMNSVRCVFLMTILQMRPLRLREIKNLFSRSHSLKQGLHSLKSRALLYHSGPPVRPYKAQSEVIHKPRLVQDQGLVLSSLDFRGTRKCLTLKEAL